MASMEEVLQVHVLTSLGIVRGPTGPCSRFFCLLSGWDVDFEFSDLLYGHLDSGLGGVGNYDIWAASVIIMLLYQVYASLIVYMVKDINIPAGN